MAKALPLPDIVEKRHTVSIWLILLGVFAFLCGCVLLFLEDGSQIRTTLPPLLPRSEAPAPKRFTTIEPAVPRTATAATAAVLNQFRAEFLDSVWREADVAGVSRATFDRAFAYASTPDPEVLALSAHQPEFDRTTGDYVSAIVNVERIAVGRARAQQQAAILGDIERRFGVDRNILLAIWGLESNFGAVKGDRSVIRSLATLASADPRRSALWRAELVAALAILEQEKLPPENLVGSWAGAMGHTQLMPSSFLKNAVDYDGTGQRDVWGSVPDALASSGRYLQAAGWASGRPWGREVVVPPDFDYALASRAAARTMSGWRVLGVRAAAGSLPPDDTAPWHLIVPAGAVGPAFLVSQNFDAILSYNQSYSYAVAVGALADRIAGNAPIQAAWPATDLPMSRDLRIELQEILAALGFDPGAIDGIAGTKTRDAIRAYQKARNIPADGHPSIALLARLRTNRPL